VNCSEKFFVTALETGQAASWSLSVHLVRGSSNLCPHILIETCSRWLERGDQDRTSYRHCALYGPRVRASSSKRKRFGGVGPLHPYEIGWEDVQCRLHPVALRLKFEAKASPETGSRVGLLFYRSWSNARRASCSGPLGFRSRKASTDLRVSCPPDAGLAR